MDLVDRLLARDVRALARAISLAEEDRPQAREVLRACFPHTGRATIVLIDDATRRPRPLSEDAIARLKQFKTAMFGG